MNQINYDRSFWRDKVMALVEGKLEDSIESRMIELPDAFMRAQQRHQKTPPTFSLPGFSKLSETIGGFPNNGGFTVIVGPTGRGKSTLVGNLWVNFSAIGKKIFTIPIETGPDDFLDMLLSIVAAKSRRKIHHADYEEAKSRWLPTFFSNRGHVLATHESRLDHIDLLAEILYNRMVRGISVAFVDNWNFMIKPSKRGDSNAENDEALHDCIVFTKKVPVHIFMVMHPRKPAESKDDRVKSIYDVKGSSTSVQESTNVWLFNPLEDPKDAPPMIRPEFCREIYIAKARYNGRGIGTKVIFSIDGTSELYSEYKLL